MKIAVDRNMPLGSEAFSTLGEVAIIDGRRLQSSDIMDTSILAIRSTTKVNAALLQGTAVEFVGTATIGTDHMDIIYLEEQGITWMYSPGCNARSVAEYITAALLQLAVTHNQPLQGQTLGIIGVGNVGSKVARQAEALGMQVLLCDPPRARAEGPDAFCDCHTLLAQSDFVTMHVPLERGGPDPTFHMANANFFARMKRGAFFLNAARGAIADTQALLEAIDASRIKATVLDTWEGEPDISRDLLNRVAIGTPHIAGHSFEGKVNGTLMVYEAACRFLQCPPAFDANQHMPHPILPETPMPASGNAIRDLHLLVKQVYDIMADDARLRETVADKAGFDTLRRQYPIRREFACTKVTGISTVPIAQQVAALGFNIP